MKQLEAITRDVESAEHSLAAIPDDADVAEHVRRLQDTTKELAVLNDRAARLDGEIAALQTQRDGLQQKLLARRREWVERELANEQAARMVKVAVCTQDTMRKFLSRATAAKIDRLAHRVTESFRFLLRKKTLVDHVQIDPATFAISLFDAKGRSIPKQRLSEGEKRVFAISVLWGLAQASPRPLPAIIDTPMARLDSEHRQHLIERYFPNASHQVIILSTDTEVDQSLCRWALCVSLREPTPPSPIDVPADSNVEMTWLVFAGEHHELYLALLKERCLRDGVEATDKELNRQFRLHLHRGIAYLASPNTVRSIGDLVGVAGQS